MRYLGRSYLHYSCLITVMWLVLVPQSAQGFAWNIAESSNIFTPHDPSTDAPSSSPPPAPPPAPSPTPPPRQHHIRQKEKGSQSKKMGKSRYKGSKRDKDDDDDDAKEPSPPKGQRTVQPATVGNNLRTTSPSITPQTSPPQPTPWPTSLPQSNDVPTDAPIVSSVEEPSAILPTVTPDVPVGECFSQESLFGSSDGDPNFFEYGYELETDPDLILGSLASMVLPPLEVAFNNFLLPTLFPETCDTSSTSRQQQQQRRLQLVGLSALPNDVTEPQVPCVHATEAENTCFYIRGSLILFLPQGTLEDVQVLNQLVRESLQRGMENDVFLSAHPSIARVTYVEMNADTIPTNTPTQDTAEGNQDRLDSESDSNNDLVLPIALASTALIVIVAGVVVFRQYTRG